MQPTFNRSALCQTRVGVARLTHLAYAGRSLEHEAYQMLGRVSCERLGAAALMDLSVIEQLRGNIELGFDYQAAALSRCRLFETSFCKNSDLSVLVFCAPLQMGGNAPIDFLLMESRVRLMAMYCIPGVDWPGQVPPHNLAFVAIPGDLQVTRPLLGEVERMTANWPVPVINRPVDIAKLDRDELAGSLKVASDDILLPDIVRRARSKLSVQPMMADRDLQALGWPLVIRPVGSHAGEGLARLNTPGDLETYLESTGGDEFFLSSYIDYRGTDGWFRKYRIVFVAGQPYPAHMAIADRWDIWYLNADMQDSAEKRNEEEAFMRTFDSGFAARHRRALSLVHERIGLDYFGIDCAELPDGRLVIFEADNALIVHDMDPRDVFPYKHDSMSRIFSAFETMLYARAGGV